MRSNEGVCHVCLHCLRSVVLPVNKDTIAPTNTEYLVLRLYSNYMYQYFEWLADIGQATKNLNTALTVS